MKCGFCTHEFTESEGEATCSRCALFGGCRFIRCPRCGYEMPRTPGLLKMLRRWAGRRAGSVAQSTSADSNMSLARLGNGCSAEVLSIEESTSQERSKLMSLGIVPGAELRLLQKFPSYLVTVGFTQLTLDKETAGLIHVRPR